ACGLSAWADSPAAKEQVIVTGTVRDAGGDPIAGAIVQPRAGTTERPPRATTDSLGRYTLSTFAVRGDTVTLYVWSTDHDTETAQERVDSDKLTLDIVMGGSNPMFDRSMRAEVSISTAAAMPLMPPSPAPQGKVADGRGYAAAPFDPRPRPPFNTEIGRAHV